MSDQKLLQELDQRKKELSRKARELNQLEIESIQFVL